MRDLSFVPEELRGLKKYSYSRLNTFNSCEHEYYLGYVVDKKLPRLDNIYGKVGTLCHDIIEGIIKGEHDPTEATKLFKDGLFEIEVQGFKFPDDKIRQNYIECITHYFNQPHEWTYDKVDIERGVYTYVDNILMIGYVDAILYKGDEVYIVDHKTSSLATFKKEDLLIHSRQLLFYAMGLNIATGIKLNKVKLRFNMLKYCLAKWKGATTDRERVCERNQIVFKLRNDIKKDLIKAEMDELDAVSVVERGIKENSFDVFPDFIKEKYHIEDYFIDVDISRENVEECLNYIKTSVTQLEKMENEKNPSIWRGRNVYEFSNTWYCTNLCSLRKHCKYYKMYCKTKMGEQEQNNANLQDLKALGLG